MKRGSVAWIVAFGVGLLLIGACGHLAPNELRCDSLSPLAPSTATGSRLAPAGCGTNSATPPDYRGAWVGDYQVTACHASDDLMAFCDGFPIGATFPVALRLAQRDSTVDGTFSLGDLSARVLGTIDSNGVLRLADADMGLEGVNVKLRAAMLNVASNADLRGTFRTVWTRNGAAGEAGYNAELRFVAKIPALAAPSATRMGHTWQGAMPALRVR